MAAYLMLLLILAGWAFFALRDERPLRIYAYIYGVNTAVALVTESIFALVLDLYTFRGYTDFLLVTLGIEPLLGILYAHYSDRLPVVRALGAAILLGGPVERIFLGVGAFTYDRGWHPLLTMIFFFGYFLWTRWLKTFLRQHVERGAARRPLG